jgi:UDP-glucose 4-epimerase
MKILITGGAGFLGNHLSEKCVNKGFYTHVVDNLSNSSLENIKNIMHIKNFKFFKEDLERREFFKKLDKDYEIIFHLAASQKSTKDGFKSNLNITQNILEFVRKSDIKKIIYTSSTRAMGLVKSDKPLDENSVCKPDTLYGKSKYECEKIINEYCKMYGIKNVIFRFPRIYGPRDWQNTFYYLAKLINFGIVPKINLNINIIYVKNLVHALLFSLSQKLEGTFIVSDGSYNVNEITNTIKRILKKNSLIEIKFPREFFKIYSYFTNSFRYALKNIVYSTEKIKKSGYKPIYSLEKGMIETLKWYKIK